MSEASLDPGDDGDDNQPTLIHNPSRHAVPMMVKNVPVPKAPAPLPRRSGSMPAVVPSSAPSSDGESTMALEGPSAFSSVMGARAAAPVAEPVGAAAGPPAPPPPDPTTAPATPGPNAFGMSDPQSLSSRSELESTQYLLAPSGQAAAFAAVPAPRADAPPPEPSTLPYPPSASPFAAPVGPAPIAPQTAPRRVPVWLWVVLAVLVLGGGGTAIALLVLQ